MFPIATMKSKKGSKPAWNPGEPSWTCEEVDISCHSCWSLNIELKTSYRLNYSSLAYKDIDCVLYNLRNLNYQEENWLGLTLRTWYPSEPPPGITDCCPPILLNIPSFKRWNILCYRAKVLQAHKNQCEVGVQCLSHIERTMNLRHDTLYKSLILSSLWLQDHCWSTASSSSHPQPLLDISQGVWAWLWQLVLRSSTLSPTDLQRWQSGQPRQPSC